MLHLMVYDERAIQYKEALERDFAGRITVYACAKQADGLPYADRIEALVSLNRLPFEILQNAPRLKWIQSLTTGTDHLTSVPELPRDLIITSCRGIHGPQMSEVAIMHMLALNRRYVDLQHNKDAHVWKFWHPPLLWKKTVAIVGMGTSGHALAACCRAFGMEVHAVVEQPRDIPGVEAVHPASELVRRAHVFDFLVLTTPLTDKTARMVNAELLAAMKPTAFLINMGRGGLVDDEALVAALRQGRIAGAGLDTFSPEPLPADSPYWDMDNVTITPHMGGASDIYPQQALEVVRENVGHYLAGDYTQMRNVVRSPHIN